MKPATAEPGQAIARLLVKSTELEPFQQVGSLSLLSSLAA